MKIIELKHIKQILPELDLLPAIEAGFVAYSDGKAVVPPVGELMLSDGEVHIKYGYIVDDEFYVVKVASGFYANLQLGLPTGNGLMLLFSQKTGELVSILLDEGYLTNVRTAVAGSIAAKYLAPKSINRIGIVGTGEQGRLQLQYLQGITHCRDVLAWDLSDELLLSYQQDMAQLGYKVETTRHTAEILASCNLVVTATPATEPLLDVADLLPGTHITAVGSDTPHKQELDAAILNQADIVVADSVYQCLQRGEIFQAIQLQQIQPHDVRELGAVIAGKAQGRSNEEQITVADLTGVAVQDIQIAAAVHGAIVGGNHAPIL